MKLTGTDRRKSLEFLMAMGVLLIAAITSMAYCQNCVDAVACKGKPPKGVKGKCIRNLNSNQAVGKTPSPDWLPSAGSKCGVVWRWGRPVIPPTTCGQYNVIDECPINE